MEKEKYIIYENGKGKEYNGYSDKLLFEGGYLNGKRNGKGKEYNYNGYIIFDEYLNGEELNGKRIDEFIDKFDNKGNLIFEGEYLNGKRNGKVKEFDNKGNLIFEGQYINDERKKGKVYINNRLDYEGEFLNDRKWKRKRI